MYACAGLFMLMHAYVLVAEFLLCHFANDLTTNKSTGEECAIVLPIDFASIMKYSVECTDTEMILSPDSFESVRHILTES